MLSRIFTRWRAESFVTPVVRKNQGKSRQPSYRPRIEALEERLLLASDTWTGASSDQNGNWSDPANWNNGVPNPGDDLVFPFETLQPLTNDLTPGITYHSINLNDGAGI